MHKSINGPVYELEVETQSAKPYAFLNVNTKLLAQSSLCFCMIAVALGIGTAVAFLIGAVSSLAAGYIAMDNATKANVRTVAAGKNGPNAALQTAFYGGATMGFAVVGLSLLAVSLLFLQAVGMFYLGLPLLQMQEQQPLAQ
jgi:Na+/H+-translocating membrane pyrophosphatase